MKIDCGEKDVEKLRLGDLPGGLVVKLDGDFYMCTHNGNHSSFLANLSTGIICF